MTWIVRLKSTVFYWIIFRIMFWLIFSTMEVLFLREWFWDTVILYCFLDWIQVYCLVEFNYRRSHVSVSMMVKIDICIVWFELFKVSIRRLTHLSITLWVCVYVDVLFVCAFVNVSVCVFVYLCVCVCLCVRLFLCMCVYFLCVLYYIYIIFNISFVFRISACFLFENSLVGLYRFIVFSYSSCFFNVSVNICQHFCFSYTFWLAGERQAWV